MKKIVNSIKYHREIKEEKDRKISAHFGVMVRVTGTSTFRARGPPGGSRPELATEGGMLYVSCIMTYKMVS